MAAESHKELTEFIKSMATQKYAISETFIFKLSRIKQEVGEDLTVHTTSRIKETTQNYAV